LKRWVAKEFAYIQANQALNFMVNKILQVEKQGKKVLRIGLSIYLISIALLTFQLNTDRLWMILVSFFLMIISALLLFHFKNPKIGMFGGLGAMAFFLLSALLLAISDVQALLPWQTVYLHVIKDILLLFSAAVLVGESLKEMIRIRITQPFPKT
jgi:uncharacterized membrane protein YkgB